MPSSISASRTDFAKIGDFFDRRWKRITSSELPNLKKFVFMFDFCVVLSPKNRTSAVFPVIVMTCAGQTQEPRILKSTMSFNAILSHFSSLASGRNTANDFVWVFFVTLFCVVFTARGRNLEDSSLFKSRTPSDCLNSLCCDCVTHSIKKKNWFDYYWIGNAAVCKALSHIYVCVIPVNIDSTFLFFEGFKYSEWSTSNLFRLMRRFNVFTPIWVRSHSCVPFSDCSVHLIRILKNVAFCTPYNLIKYNSQYYYTQWTMNKFLCL